MVRHIRPHKLFALLEAEGPERLVTVRLSKRRGLGINTNDDTVLPDVEDFSLKYLETMVLLAALKMTHAWRVFEFGTHLGATTLNLALNLPSGGKIYTMDLIRGDRFKEWEHFNGQAEKIVSMPEQDSSVFDFSPFKGAFDLIWIDANPDRTDDTRNAFAMLNPNKLSCIGWHDYDNPVANTNETCEKLPATVYHVEETAVCLYFNREVGL